MAMVAKLHLIGILKRWQSKFLDCHPSESFPAPVSASPSSRSHVANSFFFSTLNIPIHPQTVGKEWKGKVPAYKSLKQFKALQHLRKTNISLGRHSSHISFICQRSLVEKSLKS